VGAASTRRSLTAGAARALLLGAAGCGGLAVNLPFEAPAPEAAGRKYELRFRRKPGSYDRYQAKYRIRVREEDRGIDRVAGAPRLSSRRDVDEDITAGLIVHTTGKTEGKQVFDRVVIIKREVERNRLEMAPNGKVFRDEEARPPRQPDVTPNYESEPGTDLVYMPMDDLGGIARREETPYHYAWEDSLCYLLPAFPREPVGAGDRWTYDVPVVVGNEPGDRRFTLRVEFHLADFRRVELLSGRPLCAVIEYVYYGMTTGDGRAEGAASTGPVLWRRDGVEGDGKAYFDVESGRVVWRRETYSILIEAEYERPVGAGRGGEEEVALGRIRHTSRSTVEFASRLLAARERASERPSRTDR
jgi:hypothetical protein